MGTVVVTGASRGIGRYLCERLSPDHDLIGVARNAPADFPWPFIEADVSRADQLSEGFRALRIKKVFALINCAGVASMNLFMTTPAETARRVLEVNALGTMNACRTFLPALIRNRGGRIVNFSTIAVRLSLEGEAVYVASKAAVEAFTRVLAKEVGQYDITVNTISPNPISTDLIAGVDPRKIARVVDEHQAVKRMGTPDDVLNIVRFLLSDGSSLVTGQNVGLG